MLSLEELARYHKRVGTVENIEMYGFGKEVREYAYLPKWFPVKIKSQHGIVLWNRPSLHELNSALPAMLVHSRRMKVEWQRISRKPCFIFKSPFYTYRMRRKLSVSPSATGSVFFLGHSTWLTEVDGKLDSLISYLKNDLPEIFRPCTVMLHFIDIQKGIHREFLRQGFKVATAGHYYNEQFIENFYNIIREHRFALSNDIGSYTFYSIDFGLPFSLVGERPTVHFSTDELHEIELLGKDLSHKTAIEKLFAGGLNEAITREQLEIVNSEIGVSDGLGRFAMTVLLVSTSFIHFLRAMLRRIRI